MKISEYTPISEKDEKKHNTGELKVPKWDEKESHVKNIMLDRAKRNLSKKEDKKSKLNKKVDSFVNKYHGWPLSGGYDKDSDSHITEKRALRAQQKLGKDRD